MLISSIACVIGYGGESTQGIRLRLTASRLGLEMPVLLTFEPFRDSFAPVACHFSDLAVLLSD